MNRTSTVLYVEDDIDDLAIISEAFEKYTNHLRVIHAENGKKGLKILETLYEANALPSLLIIDINMPVMDGKEMLKKLRQQRKYSDIPVIMFTTSASKIDRLFAERLGAEFLSKPLTYGELESLVARFVTKCHL